MTFNRALMICIPCYLVTLVALSLIYLQGKWGWEAGVATVAVLVSVVAMLGAYATRLK